MIAIEKGDILKAVLEVADSPKMTALFAKDPLMVLLFPIIGIEIEHILFSEEQEQMNNDN